MPKPDLPPIPAIILKKKYKPRKKDKGRIRCSSKSIALIFSIGFLGSSVVGLVGYFISLLVSEVRGWFSIASAWISMKIGGLTGVGFFLGFILILIMIGLICPAIWGWTVGRITVVISKWRKCNNYLLVSFAACSNAIICYIVFQFINFKTTGMIQLTSRTYFLPDNIKWWQYVLFILDALIVILAATFYAKEEIKSTIVLICEKCDE